MSRLSRPVSGLAVVLAQCVKQVSPSLLTAVSVHYTSQTVLARLARPSAIEEREWQAFVTRVWFKVGSLNSSNGILATKKSSVRTRHSLGMKQELSNFLMVFQQPTSTSHYSFSVPLMMSQSDCKKKAFPRKNYCISGNLNATDHYTKVENVAAGRKYGTYEDPANPFVPLLFKTFGRTNLQPHEACFTKAMSSVCQAAKWAFQKVAFEFAFVDFFKNHKILCQSIGTMYRVEMLLANCHTNFVWQSSEQLFRQRSPNA